jgi:hypothetical protein
MEKCSVLFVTAICPNFDLVGMDHTLSRQKRESDVFSNLSLERLLGASFIEENGRLVHGVGVRKSRNNSLCLHSADDIKKQITKDAP